MKNKYKYIPWTDGSTPMINWNLVSFKRFYPGTNKLISEGIAGQENNSSLDQFTEGYDRPSGSEVITSSEVIGTEDPIIYRKINYGDQKNDTIYSTSPEFYTQNPTLGIIYKERSKSNDEPIKYIPKTKRKDGGEIFNYLDYLK